MPATILQTFTWSPTSNPALAPATLAGRILVLSAAAGVTSRAALQITNNTDADLYINDSGVPPPDASSAKFVIPPRCTATHPLEAARVAITYNALVINTTDYVDLVFSDDDSVTSQVWPGVVPTGGAASPIQSAISSVTTLGTWPLTLTTTSGKNIGNVYLYNNTSIMWRITISLPSVKDINVRPYSWVCLPLNQPSGSVSVNFLGSLINGLFARDSMFLAWSDVNYILPTPAGAGPLPSALDVAAATVASNPTQQFSWASGVAAAGTVNLGSLGLFAGAVQRLVITYMSVSARSAGAAVTSQIVASNGFDGLGAALNLLQSGGSVAGYNVVFSDTQLVISNLQPAASNFIQHVMAGAGAAECNVRGYLLI